MRRFTPIARLFALCFVLVLIGGQVYSQTTRPRRVARTPKTTTDKSASDPLLRPEPTTSRTAKKTSPNDPLLDVEPVKPVANTVAPAPSADPQHAHPPLQ